MRLFVFRNLFAILCLLSAHVLRADGAKPLVPILMRAGVIPFQIVEVQKETRKDKLSFLTEDLPHMVALSQKFHVLPPNIMDLYWKSSNQRQKIAEEYDVSCYLGLHVKELAQSVYLLLRMFDPMDQTMMEETLRLSDEDLFKNKAKDRIQRFLFSMLNRIPSDILVTSKQKKYITLSGGKNKNLQVDDVLEFYQVSILETHPITGAWEGFKKEPSGVAKVISLGETSSVALLQSVTEEDRVVIGDGARIDRLNGRIHFK